MEPLVFQTTDGKADGLRMGIAADGRIPSAQVPEPSTCATHTRRPEVRIGAHIDEATIGTADAGQLTRETY